MKCNKLLIHHCTKWKHIKRVHKHVINFLVILVQTFSLEVEETCHLPALMVSSEEKDLIFEANLD